MRRAASPAATISLRDGSEAWSCFRPRRRRVHPDAAARRARRGHSPTAGRGRAARPANGRPDAHRNAQPSQHAGGRTRKGGQDRVVGGAGARSGDARVVTLARHRAFRWASTSKVELTASPQAPLAALLAAGVRLRPELLVVDSLQPSDAAALGDLLSAGARGVVAAGEPQAMAGVPRQSVDVVVGVGRLHGSFVVTSIEDATGAQLFAYQNDGGFLRRTATASFAGIVHGGLRGLSSVLPNSALASSATAAPYDWAENPLRHRPISGTNRFELRGILRVGTLQRERPAEGTIA